MKRVNWHIPEAAGVNVWPSVSSTRDELRSQVRLVGLQRKFNVRNTR